MPPRIPQLETLLQAGIDPKTGLPLKVSSTDQFNLKSDIKMFLRLVDEQDAVNRYVWYNLPCNISSQELERMIYYKGQLAFFYMKDLDQFYFMPYALDGTLDFYGRFNCIHPVPMNSGDDGKIQNKAQAELLSQIKLRPVYAVLTDEDIKESDLTESCVLIHDYTKQLSQNIIPRAMVNDSLLDAMADCVPFLRTSLINSTGVKGVRVSDADQADSVFAADRTMLKAALNGRQMVPIVGSIEFQELSEGNPATSDLYMMAMQSLDNLRLSGYGIDNGGLFEKKTQYQNLGQTAVAGGPVGLVLQDGLSIRQNFCNIVNSIWDLGIWCEPAECITGADVNGDGLAYDRNDLGQSSGMEAGGEQNGNDDSAV